MTATTDSTPPEVQLWAVVEGSQGTVDEAVVTYTDEELSITPALTLVLHASAKEDWPGAIENVEIRGETALVCHDSTGAYSLLRIADWYASNPDPDPTDSNFYTWRLVSLSYSQNTVRCPTGWTLAGWSASFAASATNLAGLRSTTARAIITRQ